MVIRDWLLGNNDQLQLIKAEHSGKYNSSCDVSLRAPLHAGQLNLSV